jgi:hypothetical protein
MKFKRALCLTYDDNVIFLPKIRFLKNGLDVLFREDVHDIFNENEVEKIIFSSPLRNGDKIYMQLKFKFILDGNVPVITEEENKRKHEEKLKELKYKISKMSNDEWISFLHQECLKRDVRIFFQDRSESGWSGVSGYRGASGFRGVSDPQEP